jgi:hypothetical protein
MLKFIIFLIAAYFIYRIFKAQLKPKQNKSKVKGDETKINKEKNIDKTKIEDADFEEIE